MLFSVAQNVGSPLCQSGSDLGRWFRRLAETLCTHSKGDWVNRPYLIVSCMHTFQFSGFVFSRLPPPLPLPRRPAAAGSLSPVAPFSVSVFDISAFFK